MGIAAQLRTMDQGFGMIAAFPELKRTPIVIGESDPDGCAACTAQVYPQNNYRNGPLYASYTAATFGREQALADKHGVNIEGALTWAFEYEDQPYFAGFRVLASNGIDLPVLNVFRMLSKMSGQRVAVRSSSEVPLDAIIRDGVRGTPDVTALASSDANKLAVMVWHYHDDDVPGPEAAVELALGGLPAGVSSARLAHYRIDDEHTNPFAVWQRMGSPAGPNLQQYNQLVAAGRLGRLDKTPATVPVAGGTATLKFALPRQAVSLLVLEWGPTAK
jgi:xylan 1,4-beta-xylosidase